MFWDDILLVTEQIERYGLRTPFFDIGGEAQPCIADYNRVLETGNQDSRYITLNSRPFDHIDSSYKIIELKNSATDILNLPFKHRDSIGTAVLLGILEQVENPFFAFESLFECMRKDSLLIIGALFSYPYRENSGDYWRFTPDSLSNLAQKSGFQVLEAGWRISIDSTMGIQNQTTGKPQEIRSLYASLAKPPFKPISQSCKFSLPQEKTASSSTSCTPSSSDQSVINEKSPGAIVPQKLTPKRSCVFINTYYDAFLHSAYQTNPSLSQQSYQDQLSCLIESCFGDSDFYSRGMIDAGWKADNIIMNCEPLQNAWARENGVRANDFDIVIEQIRRLKPDVIYCQDMHAMDLGRINALKPYCSLMVGQVASSVKDRPLKSYDVIFSSLVQFVEWFRSLGIASYYQPLAFEKRLIEKLPNIPNSKRPIDVSFVGGLFTRVHTERYQFLERLAHELPIQFWGYGAENTPAQSLIRNKYGGEAWGTRMFELLSNSKITFNVHGTIDGCGGPLVKSPDENLTKNFANNMRLFEATGCGALLITDYKDNLNQLFEIGKEIVAYRSIDEAIALIKYYINNPQEAERIAHAGQLRTLKDHTYTKRMQHTAEVLERHLSYKEREIAAVDFNLISYDYKDIDSSHVSEEMLSAWQNENMAIRQRALVQMELQTMYGGKVNTPQKALLDLIDSITATGTSILEIGCSSGYYYEILEYLLHRRIKYIGVDYSEPMIKMAREFYPNAEFHVADGANLPFANKEIEIVISGCILLHVPNYVDHIKETVRVANSWVIVHRLPVRKNNPTKFQKKMAYQVETVELIFNEGEIIAEFAKHGAKLIQQIELEKDMASDMYCTSYLFKVK